MMSQRARRLPWVLCTLFGVLYVVAFFMAEHVYDSTLLLGFCTWGWPRTPDQAIGCGGGPANSHMIAFGIDMLACVIIIWLYLKNHKQTGQETIYITFLFVTASHGMLHNCIYSVLDCYIDITEIPSTILGLCYGVFAIFSCFMIAVILWLGFGLTKKVFAASVLFAAFTVSLCNPSSGKVWFLPALFCVVHPLASLTALFSDHLSFSKSVGWIFLLATFVGILELLTCPRFFRDIGGHFWYDFFLHAAVIAALPPFWAQRRSGSKMIEYTTPLIVTI